MLMFKSWMKPCSKSSWSQPDGIFRKSSVNRSRRWVGGLLAYEIAARPRLQGEAVELVGLIDADVQAGALPLPQRLQFRLQRLGQLQRRMGALGGDGTLRRIEQKVPHQFQPDLASRSDLRLNIGRETSPRAFPPCVETLWLTASGGRR